MNIQWKWNSVASGQRISTKIVLPSGTIRCCHVNVHWYGELHIVQWNGVAIRCQSQLCLRSMHLVNVHWSGGAIRYQQSLPCIASFVPTVNVATTLFWSRIASLHVTSFTHTECSLNHQSLLSHQYKAHWISTVSPASCVSPVWSTMNVHRITSLSQFHAQ